MHIARALVDRDTGGRTMDAAGTVTAGTELATRRPCACYGVSDISIAFCTRHGSIHARQCIADTTTPVSHPSIVASTRHQYTLIVMGTPRRRRRVNYTRTRGRNPACSTATVSRQRRQTPNVTSQSLWRRRGCSSFTHTRTLLPATTCCSFTA